MKRWETSPASRAVWRGALTTLCKEGKWNSEWLEKEAELVEQKKSREPRAVREFASYIVKSACMWMLRGQGK